VKPTPDTQAYAFKILDALVSGELEDGIRVSYLIYAQPDRVQPRIRAALQLLEKGKHVEVRDKGRGRPPARVFLQRGMSNG
jgi:hypothetical protein